MPIIHKNAEAICYFGTGDIAVITAYQEGDPTQTRNELWLLNHSTPQPIGVAYTWLNGKTTDELKPPVRLVFGSVASLNVVRTALDELHASMTALHNETRPPCPS